MAIEQPMQQLTIVKPAVTLRLEQVQILFLEEYAYAFIALLDEDGAVVSRQTMPMEEAELAGWGSDDTVVVDIIKAKLGL
jgi:hypothetical protein